MEQSAIERLEAKSPEEAIIDQIGLGVPEAVLAFLLMRFGVATSEVVPLSLPSI